MEAVTLTAFIKNLCDSNMGVGSCWVHYGMRLLMDCKLSVYPMYSSCEFYKVLGSLLIAYCDLLVRMLILVYMVQSHACWSLNCFEKSWHVEALES